jgi:hypothetical protein
LRSVAFRVSGLMSAGLLACMLAGGAAAMTESPAASPTTTEVAIGTSDAAFDTFLDRLMQSESNGRDTAKNPRSSALGAFQFIRSTFLDVMRRHFATDIANMNEADILALRTDRGFARRAAEAFSKENLDYLADRGLKPTFGDLRLAFLLGPVGAARVLEAPAAKPVAEILDDKVVAANPFMRRMSAADLIARAHRDVGAETPREAEPPAREVEPPAREAAAAQPVRSETAPAEEPKAGKVAEPPAREAAAAQPARSETAPAEEAKASNVSARPAARKAARTVAARSERGRTSSRTAVINVKCNPKLASCQRWIDRQVAKVAGIADRT